MTWPSTTIGSPPLSGADQAFNKGGFSGTPTVLFDGKNIYQDRTMTPAKLKQMVQEQNKG